MIFAASSVALMGKSGAFRGLVRALLEVGLPCPRTHSSDVTFARPAENLDDGLAPRRRHPCAVSPLTRVTAQRTLRRPEHLRAECRSLVS
jgi:hypothetical protein